MTILRIIAVLIALGTSAASAAEPVKHIPIYVEPFYGAGRTPGETPRIAVGARFNDLLASSKREDIVSVAEMIKANPQTVTRNGHIETWEGFFNALLVTGDQKYVDAWRGIFFFGNGEDGESSTTSTVLTAPGSLARFAFSLRDA